MGLALQILASATPGPITVNAAAVTAHKSANTSNRLDADLDPITTHPRSFASIPLENGTGGKPCNHREHHRRQTVEQRKIKGIIMHGALQTLAPQHHT